MPEGRLSILETGIISSQGRASFRGRALGGYGMDTHNMGRYERMEKELDEEMVY